MCVCVCVTACVCVRGWRCGWPPTHVHVHARVQGLHKRPLVPRAAHWGPQPTTCMGICPTHCGMVTCSSRLHHTLTLTWFGGRGGGGDGCAVVRRRTHARPSSQNRRRTLVRAVLAHQTGAARWCVRRLLTKQAPHAGVCSACSQNRRRTLVCAALARSRAPVAGTPGRR
jgi:hypothetical protein